MPTDLDILRHVNNGIYLSLLDLARTDLLIRSGLAPRVRRRRWVAVVTAESIRFRRSLTIFQRFHVESRVVGWDDRNIYVDQRFIRGDELIASALVAGRFLGPEGSVPPAAVLALAGLEEKDRPAMPEWAERLAGAQQALASSAIQEDPGPGV